MKSLRKSSGNPLRFPLMGPVWIDLFNLSATNAEQDRVLQTAGSVVAMVLETDIQDNNDRSDPADPFSGTPTLSYHTFKSRYGLCDSERFKEQPSVSCCSGALIGED